MPVQLQCVEVPSPQLVHRQANALSPLELELQPQVEVRSFRHTSCSVLQRSRRVYNKSTVSVVFQIIRDSVARGVVLAVRCRSMVSQKGGRVGAGGEMVNEEWPAGSIRCKAFITTVATAMCKGRSMVNTFLSIARAFQTGDVLEIETRTNYFFNGSACSCAPVRPPPCHHCVDIVHPCIYK